MERIWLARYPKGVPVDVDVAAYRNIAEVLETSAAKFGPRAAFINTVSYTHLTLPTKRIV